LAWTTALMGMTMMVQVNSESNETCYIPQVTSQRGETVQGTLPDMEHI